MSTPPRVIDLTYQKAGVANPGQGNWGGSLFPLTGLTIGEKIQFRCPNGAFKLEFGRWPFAGKKHAVMGAETLTLSKAYPFKFDCYLKENGKWVQYGGGNGKATRTGNSN